MRSWVLAVLLALPACAQAADPTLLAKLESLAARGNAEALYHLGMSYLTGTNAPLDRQRALGYFRRAAALGDPLAAYKLGCLYEGQYGVLSADLDKALTYKLVAARAGYALAQQDVGILYADRKQLQPALEWLGKAAAQGASEGLMAYASAHNPKTGIAPDAAITDAYFTLLFRRTGESDAQRTWLETFEAEMSPADRQRAQAIVEHYRPEPTALTIKALSGQRAAETLVTTAP